MSSVLATVKQIPIDSQYYVSIRTGTIVLQYFVNDAAASTTSYVSGAAAGNFVNSNVTPTFFDISDNTTQVFRDMGVTIVSSGRTFRSVQLLTLDGSGQTGWTSSTSGTPGVWQASREGISGGLPTNSLADSGFSVFYFETGARGLGIAQGLVRYG
jgi:hypothetical protein